MSTDEILPTDPRNYRRVTHWDCPRCEFTGGATFGDKVPETEAKTQIMRWHFSEEHSKEYPMELIERMTICEHTQMPWEPDCGCNPTRTLIRHMTKPPKED